MLVVGRIPISLVVHLFLHVAHVKPHHHIVFEVQAVKTRVVVDNQVVQAIVSATNACQHRTTFDAEVLDFTTAACDTTQIRHVL